MVDDPDLLFHHRPALREIVMPPNFPGQFGELAFCHCLRGFELLFNFSIALHGRDDNTEQRLLCFSGPDNSFSHKTTPFRSVYLSHELMRYQKCGHKLQRLRYFPAGTPALFFCQPAAEQPAAEQGGHQKEHIRDHHEHKGRQHDSRIAGLAGLAPADRQREGDAVRQHAQMEEQ